MEVNTGCVHGGDRVGWAERHPGRPLLDFSANINPFGLPESIRRALAEGVDEVCYYPDPHCRALRRALGELEGVEPGRIVCGNGAADLIYRLARVLGRKPALVPVPTFGEYGAALEQAGAEVEYYPLKAENGFALDRKLLYHRKQGGSLFLCSPNNPTGLLPQQDFLEEAAGACRESGTLLAVDECFLDFVEEGETSSAKGYLDGGGPMVIFKAFTKSYAIPGLRLGYCLVSSRELAGELEAAGAPWSVSALAQRCGLAAVNDRAYLAGSRRAVRRWARQLAGDLAAAGLQVWKPGANFVFFRSHERYLEQKLEEYGVLIRSCHTFRGLERGYYRVAVRTPEENARLLAALQKTLGQQAAFD